MTYNIRLSNGETKEVRERILDLYKIASRRSKLFNDYLQEGLNNLWHTKN